MYGQRIEKNHSEKKYIQINGSSTFLVDLASTPIKITPKTSTPIKFDTVKRINKPTIPLLHILK